MNKEPQTKIKQTIATMSSRLKQASFFRTFCVAIVTMIASACCYNLAFCQTKTTSDYRLSVNDLLEISVYEEPDLSKTVRVSSDGAITFPLLGSLQAAGLTAKELEIKITELLEKDFLVNPQVSVFIKEHAKIFINGKVKSPGAYELKSGLTVKEALTLAGGLTEEGNPNNVKLIRTVNGQKQIKEVNILEGKNSSSDITLSPLDEIVVEDLGSVTVLGQVIKPGSYKLKQNMTVTGGIALAGGFTREGDARSVKINRVLNGQKQTLEVNTTQAESEQTRIVLQSSDEIIVGELGTIVILGQVRSPGRYTLKQDMTVVEMIAVAGGLTNIAAPNGTKVIRIKNGKKEVITIPLKSILRGGDKSKDILLQSGDTVVVPESFF